MSTLVLHKFFVKFCENRVTFIGLAVYEIEVIDLVFDIEYKIGSIDRFETFIVFYFRR